MSDWLALVIGLAPVAVALLLLARRTDARVARAGPDRAAPDEPCWTETISSDGRLSYGRSHCVNEELMEMDPRLRDFPSASQG
ncbi:MAG TPA: hypothetical protein VGO55_08285 [Allosphingosinicella sp.]|nr:hypothetical protein [Allosphingosinicella sp.]